MGARFGKRAARVNHPLSGIRAGHYLSLVRIRVLLAAIGWTAATAGCARSPKVPPQTPAVTNSPTPLASLAGQRIIVLPLHYLSSTDTLGLANEIQKPKEFLRSLDDEIAFALGERGLSKQWVLPVALQRSQRRNVGHSVDPYGLAAGVLRHGGPRRIPQLPDPLATQLRSLVALSEARYALFPVEVRFENTGGTARAIMTVALLDARLANVRWSGEVASDTMRTLAPGLAASLANKMANLITAP